MKQARTAAVLVLTALLATGAAWAQRAGSARAALPAPDGEVIVAFKPEASLLRKHALAAHADAASARATLALRATALGARIGRTLQAGESGGANVQLVRAAGVDAATLARQLAADPDVAYAEPNRHKRRTTAPNDPLYAVSTATLRPAGPDSGQWYLRAPDSTTVSGINIEAAWAQTTGGANVVVAVLDTGVRFDHPDLKGRLLPGYDFVADAVVANDGDGRDADPSDPGDWITSGDAANSTFSGCAVENSSWHGTSTASLIGAAANDGVGMAGGAPGVRILPVRVLGKCYGSDIDIVAAMRWAAGIHIDGVPDNPNPAKVISMSLGGCPTSGPCTCTTSYQTAINEILARGASIVLAAGNSDGGPVEEPANCSGVISVLALRHAGTKVGFSSLGPEVSIAAPGGNCVNTAVGSRCLYPILAATNSGTTVPTLSGWTDSFNVTVGTSFSTPLVAAVAALAVSRKPDITPSQVKTALQSTARPFPTTGAVDTFTVTQCVAPQVGQRQAQCYCNTTYCGAGMLDAGAAIASLAAAPFLSVTQNPLVPEAGQATSFSITGLQLPSGRTVQSYQWTLSNGGTVATGFSSATNASTAALTPAATGTFTVQLLVTDSAGGTLSSAEQVTVAPPPVTVPPPSSGGGGGGGAASGAWVAGVGLAAAVLMRLRASRRRP